MFSKTQIEKYFLAEKAESFVFMAIGIAGIVVALLFYITGKAAFYKGMAIPFLAIGILLGSIGFIIYQRSNADIERVCHQLQQQPEAIHQLEIPRMETVMKNFVVYRYVEIVLAITGILLFFFLCTKPGAAFWSGFGAGLTIMAVLALSADYFAERRGAIYLSQMKQWKP